ncbi:ferritin-like domain-containing protein [uncultured Nocardioides sp.]|uniref:ferritin-like domain-containing protein n=1 Tax=uncultured Nocardioides sp. TaxID=198441 RepID=UPI0025DFBA8D|nr:ferritin-like domain-containing protein [uncultured Nocardioides sp.]
MRLVEGLQTTLAAEHAAVWLYGVLGAQTSQAGEPALYDGLVEGYRRHRARRDQLTGLVRDAGAEPVAAAPAYDLPEPLADVAQVRRVALGVEEGCAATYSSLVAGSVGDDRRWAITALTDAAVRQLAFGGVPQAFPGAPELGPTTS